MGGGHLSGLDSVRVVMFSPWLKSSRLLLSEVEEFLKEVNLDGPEQGQTVTHP